MLFIDWIKENKSHEIEILKEHKDAISKRNNGLIRLILLTSAIIFAGSLVASMLFERIAASYMPLSLAYCVLLLVIFIILWVIHQMPNAKSIGIVYITYAIGIVYCIYTSAFLTPNYTCVTILAVLFQFPVLYLDKTWRINLFIICSTGLYLLAIFPWKDNVIFVDEVINTIGFTTMALIIGSFTRKSLLENFLIKQKLEHNACVDYITNLYNRRKLFEDLELHQNKTGIKPVTGIVMIDIDFFKKYNDTYGHQAGDQCLRRIADCFSQFSIRYNLPFYRYGGEEFLGIFFGDDPDEFLQITEEIRRKIESMGIEHKGSHIGVVTVSVGVSVLESDTVNHYKAFITSADHALYKAKGEGRNKVVCYES